MTGFPRPPSEPSSAFDVVRYLRTLAEQIEKGNAQVTEFEFAVKTTDNKELAALSLVHTLPSGCGILRKKPPPWER